MTKCKPKLLCQIIIIRQLYKELHGMLSDVLPIVTLVPAERSDVNDSAYSQMFAQVVVNNVFGNRFLEFQHLAHLASLTHQNLHLPLFSLHIILTATKLDLHCYLLGVLDDFLHPLPNFR